MSGTKSESPRRDLTGQVFGRLTVLGFVRNVQGEWAWECRCACGRLHVVSASHLRKDCKSCGCLRKETTGATFREHGLAKTPEHVAWLSMKARCHIPSSSAYSHYGGRGIIVCDEWRNDFTAFLNHIGPRPSPKHSVDRYPDRTGNYEPGNVRWATREEQMANRYNTLWLTSQGRTLTAAEWAQRTGLKRATIHDRHKRGLSDDDVLRPLKVMSHAEMETAVLRAINEAGGLILP